MPISNPEIKEAMALGMDYAKRNNADLLLATDPDCDRVGIAVKDKNGDYQLLTGNQTGMLLLITSVHREQSITECQLIQLWLKLLFLWIWQSRLQRIMA